MASCVLTDTGSHPRCNHVCKYLAQSKYGVDVGCDGFDYQKVWVDIVNPVEEGLGGLEDAGSGRGETLALQRGSES